MFDVIMATEYYRARRYWRDLDALYQDAPIKQKTVGPVKQSGKKQTKWRGAK